MRVLVVEDEPALALRLQQTLITGSLGILSESAHSLLDLGAASLTWFAVRVEGIS